MKYIFSLLAPGLLTTSVHARIIDVAADTVSVKLPFLREYIRAGRLDRPVFCVRARSFPSR